MALLPDTIAALNKQVDRCENCGHYDHEIDWYRISDEGPLVIGVCHGCNRRLYGPLDPADPWRNIRISVIEATR